MKNTLIAVATTFALGSSTIAVAQMPTWSAEQTAVWTVVAQSWADEVAQNGKWPNAYAHSNMVAWSQDFPIPRTKDSINKWSRFNDTQSKTLVYEVSPVAIAVAGNTAVVNYVSISITQRGSDKPEREVSGLIETLVKDGGSWKFLSSTSFSGKK